MSDFTHFNEQGRAKMVDVGEKPISQRIAVAAGRVLVNEKTFALIQSGGMKKGDVLTVAQIAGVMGAKRTPDIIPMCHPILMDGINLELSLDADRHSVEIKATVSCDGRTGVEMEALTAVSLAFPMQSLMVALGGGTGVGVNALLSRSLGEIDFDRANAAAKNGIFLAEVLAWMGADLILVPSYFLMVHKISR